MSTTHHHDGRSQELLEKLERSAANWQNEIGDCEHQVSKFTGTAREELRRALDELKARWTAVRKRVDEIQEEGEEQLEGAREWAQGRYRELASLGQRVSEQVLDAGDGTERTRYFLSPSSAGGWELKRAGAAHPVKLFDDKRSALAWSTRYARQHEPSTLVVRRQDGTFQQTRTYGSLKAG